MNWRLVLLGGGVVIALGAFQLSRQGALPCPTTDQVLNRGEITEGAMVFAAANLRYMHYLQGLSGNHDTAQGALITADTVKDMQPDCCKIIRNPPDGLVRQTEQVRILNDGPAVRAYVEVTIDNPDLLPTQVRETTTTIAIDVCGDPVQDWLNLTSPTGTE